VPFRRRNYDIDVLDELEQQIDLNNDAMDVISKPDSLSPAEETSTNSSVDYDVKNLSSKKLLSPINSSLSPMFNPLGNTTKQPISTKSPGMMISQLVLK